MATITNARLQRTGLPEFGAAVPLESLPFAAAILGRSGEIVGSNAAWHELHGEAGEGASGLEWCPAALRAEMLAAIAEALDTPGTRHVRDYSPGGSSRRISVADCG